MAKLAADIQALGESRNLTPSPALLGQLQEEFDRVRDRLADELQVGKQSPS
nr:hypothetical protein [Nitrospirota bacterium]